MHLILCACACAYKMDNSKSQGQVWTNFSGSDRLSDVGKVEYCTHAGEDREECGNSIPQASHLVMTPPP